MLYIHTPCLMLFYTPIVHSVILSSLRAGTSSLCLRLSTWFAAKPKTDDATRAEKHPWLNSFGEVVKQVKWFTITHVVYSTVVHYLGPKCHVINCVTKLNVHCLHSSWLCIAIADLRLDEKQSFQSTWLHLRVLCQTWGEARLTNAFLCYTRSVC